MLLSGIALAPICLTGTQSASGELSQMVQEKMHVTRSHLGFFFFFLLSSTICPPTVLHLLFWISADDSVLSCTMNRPSFTTRSKLNCDTDWICRYVCFFMQSQSSWHWLLGLSSIYFNCPLLKSYQQIPSIPWYGIRKGEGYLWCNIFHYLNKGEALLLMLLLLSDWHHHRLTNGYVIEIKYFFNWYLNN